MKILSLGTDKSVIDPQSKAYQRIAEYNSLVEDFIVLTTSGNSKIVGFFKLFYEAKNIIKSKEVDIITSQDAYFIGLISILLGQKFHKGVEIQIHGWEKFNFFRKYLAQFVLLRANSIRVVSQRLKKQLVTDFGVGENKITVVPIFIDTSVKTDNIARNNPNPIFLTVSRLVSVKNIKLQIDAMCEIVKKYPKAELWIIGDGPERCHLEEQINEFGLAKNVKLLGWQNPDQYYASADVFLLTSNQEGWGLVVIEATSHGLPIIMTDVGCAGEVIKHNESGIVIPIGDKSRLIQAMEGMIKDKELRGRLAKGAMESLKKLPTKEETLRLYKKSWEKALR
jgi:glycosyltransferase involved in cell wall biosynthesis